MDSVVLRSHGTASGMCCGKRRGSVPHRHAHQAAHASEKVYVDLGSVRLEHAHIDTSLRSPPRPAISVSILLARGGGALAEQRGQVRGPDWFALRRAEVGQSWTLPAAGCFALLVVVVVGATGVDLLGGVVRGDLAR
jgi:hypothetical protein